MTAMGELGHILGEDVGKEELRSSGKANPRNRVRSCSSVKELTRLVHKLSARIEIRKMPINVKDASKRNDFSKSSWLAEDARGNAPDALILDSAEEYPIEDFEHVLRMCGGDDADYLKIAEI